MSSLQTTLSNLQEIMDELAVLHLVNRDELFTACVRDHLDTSLKNYEKQLDKEMHLLEVNSSVFACKTKDRLLRERLPGLQKKARRNYEKTPTIIHKETNDD